ncbi:MAG: hypothetical protein LC126_21745 [Bryobacterales bacterium]|nr:hypothetical protein [Bryobacterales bacterium]
MKRQIKRLLFQADRRNVTILNLLVVTGERCEKLLGRVIRNVPVNDVQCDEMWGFIQKKQKQVYDRYR